MEVLYLRFLLESMVWPTHACAGHTMLVLESMGFTQEKATRIYEDNSARIEWGNNLMGGQKRAKHILRAKHRTASAH